MKTNTLCVTLILFSLPHFASAQVYKCKSTDGAVMFQGTPCPSETRLPPRVLPTVGQKAELTPQQKNNGVGGTNWDASKPRPVVEIRPAAPQYSPPPERQAATANQKLPAREADFRQAQLVKQSNAALEQANSANKANECNQARQQLGVNKESRPIYHYDNNGDKQYVADADRQARLEAAQQRVANACN
ncbi:hypothetical protein AAKU67_003153 [Oxalobacteraceae bacterium GrIS 2.11]